MFKFTTKRLARASVVAALYTLLSLVTLPVASGAIQFRASEALTILPLIFPETVFGLFVGCAVSNIVTGCAALDIVFGSVVTLVAGFLTYYTGRLLKNKALKIFVGGLYPVFLNAFLLPLIWYFCYGQLEYLYILQVCFLVVSQSVSVYVLGTPVYLAGDRLKMKGVAGFTD